MSSASFVYDAKVPKILEKVLKIRKFSIILAFIGGFFYWKTVFNLENMELTRISEHALMPGLVTPRFDRSGLSLKIFRDLDSLETLKKQREYICQTFIDWGLSCYEQKWKSNIPTMKMSGKNVYGWVRGQRNDGTESILIGVRLGKSQDELMMISHVMAFVNFAKDQVYWARDILIVFIDGKESKEKAAIAFDAFLGKYHKMDYLNENETETNTISDEIVEQSGVLLAGIVYEMSNRLKRNQILTQMNGINGQQANLDLFNSVAKIANKKVLKEFILYNVDSKMSSNNEYLISLRALWTQAFIPIEGVHSVLGKYGVQGMTIGVSNKINGIEIGEFIESICRSLNNVLERLHQSYFMYVLGDSLHFASIAYYIPLVGIIGSPLFIMAYYEWRQLKKFQIPSFYFVYHAYGFMIYSISTWIYSNIGNEFTIGLSDGGVLKIGKIDEMNEGIIPSINVTIGILIASMIPIGLINWKNGKKYEEVTSVKIMCQLEAALLIGCVSLINFGLSLISAIFIVPIVFLFNFEAMSRKQSIIRTIVLIIFNPIVVMTIAAIGIRDIFELAPITDQIFDLKISIELVKRLLKEHIIFGSHHFVLFSIFVIPIWNLLFVGASDYFEEEEKLKNE